MTERVGNELYISKGDTATFRINLLENKQPYILQPNDEVVIHIGAREQVLTNSGSSYVLWVLPADLPAADYLYDIDIVFGDTGEHNHLLYPTLYRVCEVAK